MKSLRAQVLPLFVIFREMAYRFGASLGQRVVSVSKKNVSAKIAPFGIPRCMKLAQGNNDDPERQGGVDEDAESGSPCRDKSVVGVIILIIALGPILGFKGIYGSNNVLLFGG